MNETGIPLLRVLTEKSSWKFGKYKDFTIGDILNMNKQYIGWMYYCLANISFCDAVLKEADITPIEKPGTDEKLFKDWKKKISEGFTREQKWHGVMKWKRIEKQRKKVKMRDTVKGNHWSKAEQAWYNQGHR